MSTAGEGAEAPVEKKIFVLFPPETSELLVFSLERRFHCKAIPVSELTPAVQAFKAEPFDLALLDSTFADWMIVFEQVRAAKIPFVIYHPEAAAPEVRGPKIRTYKENELMPAVLKAMAELPAAPREGAGSQGTAYAPLPFSLLRKINPQVADLYIGISELKYLKLFHAGHTFTAEDEQKYQKKKVTRLFVRHENLEKVTAQVNAMVEKLLKLKRPLKKEEAPVKTDAVEVMHELVKQVGFTPEVQKLVKNNMDLVVKEMQATPSLSGILKNMEINKDKYIAAHSSMLAEVSCALAIAMEWGSDMSLKKIAMAALLHDMSITDQRLCAVKDMDELEARKAEFDPGQLEEYASHSKRAAILIQGMKEVPADVDKIVYQHHELPRGTGFPEAVGHTHIHPLAGTMMVAHDLVDWLIDHPGQAPDMAAFAEAHKEKYAQGTFKKIMKALQDLKI